jgi:prolyl-tRNA synthetase
MRLSQLFFTSLRDDPADVEMPSHRLLLRAGYVRQLGAGIYSLLPLGFRVAQKVTQIIREEQDAIGGQELLMPVVHPADLWRESGRYDKIGPEMARFKDRAGRDMVLAMTHEEVIADLLRDVVKSYRQLPVMLYHFQTKFRDEPRSRGGLIRVREFTMKDAYSCDLDEAGLDKSYQAQYGAYEKTFKRLGLDTIAVASDVGMMGGSEAHEFMLLNPAGEDTLVLCDACGYAANQQVALTRRPVPVREAEAALAEVATPGTATIADLAAFLGISPAQTAKAIFFTADDGRLITAIVRGDDEVNETKLSNAVKAGGLRPAREDEIRAAGMEPGYASPVGARNTFVVVDPVAAGSSNLVAGANRAGFHLRNVNVGRDFTPDLVTDIANAREGDACPTCGEPVTLKTAIEVGNIFKLGTRYTEALGATYLGEDGQEHPIIMGSYGVGVGRNMACVVEAHHDDKGIVWPAAVAPYAAHLVTVSANRDPRVTEIAEAMHQHSIDVDNEILYDDREESPGVKFTDAELLGMPWIFTVSPRSLAAGGIEVTERATGERTVRPVDEVRALIG